MPVEQADVSSPEPTLIEPANGDKAKARDILTAIRTLKTLEAEDRLPSESERNALQHFHGFGPVALTLFPDPITGQYKHASWQQLGEELKSLLTPDEYESARRTVFNAFYTSPDVIRSMHQAIARLGVGEQATLLEPGCGTGNFLSLAKPNQHFIGVELDDISGRIARKLHPNHDIRIENFRDTKLPPLDGVIGNVPFANIKLAHHGQRFALHDYFFAKSLDALKPGGVLALVTSHFTMDKTNAAIREYLGEQADFVGAIRLPSDAFKREGTSVVTDIIFLKKRAPDQPAQHVDEDWLKTGALNIDGTDVTVNQYFLNHPEMVLGEWSLQNSLYHGAASSFSLASNGDLPNQLLEAVQHLPRYSATPTTQQPEKAPETPFIRPPALRHISEGSFFIADDGAIMQVEDGRAIPAMHGQTLLHANGTLLGKRMAALLGLRDAARLVLQAQNEDWPLAERDATRTELNRLYDKFVNAYGPINKTTFSETKTGTVIRRMPNLLKFREDPDAMLVMSLEDYDEVTAKAEKTAIFGRDVVGRKPTIESVNSAEEGLLVSLDQKGIVDLDFIAGIYRHSPADIIEELGDLIFLDPASRQWQTADLYLSGNVREKLAVAQSAGPEFQRNAKHLQAVQPADVLPGEIDANLGSPWIPESDLQQFAAELFQVEANAVQIGHVKKDAIWSVDANYTATQSVAATSEFGTGRVNGTQLLEQALNMKSPTVYDTIQGPNGDERIVNQEETLATREKQKRIKEKFKDWVFADPDRSERLVRIYNDTYNNIRLRQFDGSHLAFDGMNQTIELRPHQKNAIWRGMSSGNTLLAHAVGAGKTFTMAATGMKMKQAGLIHKPMYVVPNHMLEQFSREFMQLYPNARLLVASKEDMTKERRKRLTAKIASGEWDGIVVTHSSFERIGMSKQYQQQFLQQQIDEYTDLIVDAAMDGTSNRHRNLIKSIEKQKANRENKLKDLASEDKKDDGLVFDELGVDHIFIDEAHYFKNLETPTKMERVAGIQTGGSQRAFDIYMKARYLSQQHAAHGVTFATGTPISNTMVELYNLQRFLDPQGLIDRGIEHFDAWAATFGEVVESMEISPDGASLRPRNRFARFNNLPELQQMFRAYADVQTPEMLDLPRPKLKTGKPITVACPMSDEQERLQRELIDRYDRLRTDKIDPRIDNALAITTDGRKLALDARMLDAEATDFADSKVNALVDNLVNIWHETEPTRGTQLVFADMGIKPTAWGYSAYDDIVRKLIDRGIPRDQIAVMGDADSDAKKQSLFEKVRSGAVRILLGSTQKMGTGTNVQKRLAALHHLDAPWKPAEVEQRDGRILRQGNQNSEVAIFRYVTEGSFDAYMWQALETKARFISQVMTGSSAVRRADDIGGQELSYAEVKAIASGNPAVLTLAEADAELQRLAMLKKSHTDEQFLIRRKLKELPETIDRMQHRIHGLKVDQATLAAHADDRITIGSQPVHPDDLHSLLGQKLDSLPAQVSTMRDIELGEYHGLRFGIRLNHYSAPDVYLAGTLIRSEPLTRQHQGPRAVLNALTRLANSYPDQLTAAESKLRLSEKQLTDYQTRIDTPFVHQAFQHDLTELRDQLKRSLALDSLESKDDDPNAAVLSARIKQTLDERENPVAPESTAADTPATLNRKSIRNSIAVFSR